MLLLVLTFSILASIVWLFPSSNATPVQQQYSDNDNVTSIQTAQTTVSEPSSTQTLDYDMQDYYAKRLGQLQAESIRLKALITKLAMMTGTDTSEFLLDEQPPQGGLEQDGYSLSPEYIRQEMEQLTQQFTRQDQQLASIQAFIITDDNIQSAIPQGRPIESGWISSYYGKRIDPFSGKKTFHHGLDFAGKSGSNVLAVADGIISWTGKRSGYGHTVEIDHGNGYVTLYGHNQKVTVKAGDRIQRGQVIALMGSTGRSTGPHVHFEVLRDGRKINPYTFVKR